MKYYWLTFLILSSCVSVSIEKHENVDKAKNYSILTPSAPFTLKSKEPFDKFWLNPKNANAIALITACGKIDPTLEDLVQNSLAGINDLEKINTSRFDYNKRVALSQTHTGDVDGVKIKILSLAFKKNHCNYSLSYFGKAKNFDADLEEFNKVKNNFRVQ